ncbi:hypothetical protein [Escherichia coli]|uniref:hypothetical protein n=1 Tax=Escherichia coli TaxID=562 RepID=UPI0013AFA51F|nr:hypothetical protein [Escherichia coli]
MKTASGAFKFDGVSVKGINSIAIVEVRGNGWSAGFYLKPNTAVKVYGNKPDLNEFRDSCALSMFPLPAIDALYAAACVAFDAVEPNAEVVGNGV